MTPPSQPADSPRRASGLSDEVLPCPFCGKAMNEESLTDISEGVAYEPCYSVNCDGCGVCMPGDRSIAAAVAAWNSRAPVTLPKGADDEDVLTVERIRNMDGEQFLDRFFNTIGMPNATVEDEEREPGDEEETVYVIKVSRDEFDDAAEKYLLEKFGRFPAPDPVHEGPKNGE